MPGTMHHLRLAQSRRYQSSILVSLARTFPTTLRNNLDGVLWNQRIVLADKRQVIRESFE